MSLSDIVRLLDEAFRDTSVCAMYNGITICVYIHGTQFQVYHNGTLGAPFSCTLINGMRARSFLKLSVGGVIEKIMDMYQQISTDVQKMK